MSALVETRSLTAAEFLLLGDLADRCELIRGEVVRMAPAGNEHCEIGMALMAELAHWARRHRLGRCVGADAGIILARDPDTVRVPDGAFTVAARLGQVSPQFSEIIPDLVLEVVSPSDRPAPVAAKTEEWLAAGVRVVLVVWPASRAVDLHRAGSQVVTLGDDDVLTVPELLPGFELPVREIFE